MENPQSPRRILANVSPNIKPVASAPIFMKNPTVGSPLKRSFTMAMEEGGGLLYLKRRRLAEDEVLSEMSTNVSHPRQELLLDLPLDDASADLPCIESIQSPTEPNTPSDDDVDVTQGSSAERRSFSSLINYDPSSQTSNFASSAPSSAEMLRLRLRIAMYKVRTNQIEISFEDLKSEKQSQELARRKAIDDAVTELRREAQEVLARAPCQQSLDPPTSPGAVHGGHVLLHPLWHRSLPASTSPKKLVWTSAAETPLRASRTANTPPDTGPRLSHVLEPELTSSVVRGRVAEGLLGLRNAV